MSKEQSSGAPVQYPPGPLSEPIQLFRLHYVWPDDTPEDFIATYYDRVARPLREKKLPVLGEYFGIDIQDTTGWIELSLKLASLHVPGFHVAVPKPRRGPKGKWTFTAKQKLVAEVENRLADGQTERAACEHIARKGIISNKAGTPFSGGALRSQLKHIRESGFYEAFISLGTSGAKLRK